MLVVQILDKGKSKEINGKSPVNLVAFPLYRIQMSVSIILVLWCILSLSLVNWHLVALVGV